MYLLEFGGDHDEFAVAEAAAAAQDVSLIAPGVATATALDPQRVRTLAFTRHASRLITATTGDIDTAVSALESVDIDRSGTIAVRARTVRGTAAIDTQAAERALGTVLVDRGFTVDLDAPDHELRAVFSNSTVALGWFVTDSIREYGPRQPTNRPFFQPGSMSPLLARALVNLAVPGPTAEAVLVDPMCGTGGTLIEAGLVGVSPIGIDAQPHMVTGTRQNLDTYLTDGYSVMVGDATALPLRSGFADAVLVDVPYGRQSKISGHDHTTLVTGALAEAERIAARAVVVAATRLDDELDTVDFQLDAVFERRVHRSLVRYIHVLS